MIERRTRWPAEENKSSYGVLTLMVVMLVILVEAAVDDQTETNEGSW